MKKIVLSFAVVAMLGLSFTSCRETEEKNDDDVNVTIEKAEEETEGALEKTGKAIDEAVDETKEAGEAVEDVVDNDDN